MTGDLVALPTATGYLTPGQVAEWLQVSDKTVYRWAASDPTMPALRIGGVVRFPQERLERWLREREQGVSGRRRSQKQMLGGGEVRAVPGMSERATGASAQSCAQERAE